jgi:hypothetical protein
MMVALEVVPDRLAEPRATKPGCRMKTPAAGYAGRSSILSGELETGRERICFYPRKETLDSLSTFSSNVFQLPLWVKSRTAGRAPQVMIKPIIHQPSASFRGGSHYFCRDVSPVTHLLTMFIILPSSNECKAYLTLAPFTVVSAYIIVNKSFYCVIGFDIIQDFTLQLWSLNI